MTRNRRIKELEEALQIFVSMILKAQNQLLRCQNKRHHTIGELYEEIRIAQNGLIKLDELAKRYRLSTKPTKRRLRRLVKANVVDECGATKRRCWKHGDKIVEAAYEDAKKNPPDYFELSGRSSSFPKKWNAGEFSAKYELNSHFADHGKGVGANNPQEYLEMAQDFLHSPLGASGDVFIAQNGDVYKFDENTLYFAIARPNGVIRTFYNLGDNKSRKKAIDYWNNQINKKG